MDASNTFRHLKHPSISFIDAIKKVDFKRNRSGTREIFVSKIGEIKTSWYFYAITRFERDKNYCFKYTNTVTVLSKVIVKKS